MIFIGANNAVSTLAIALSPTDILVQLAVGTGSDFPSPTDNEVFAITLQNDSGTVDEVMYCTIRNGDVLTVERAQENTTAVTWPVGTVIENLFTDGTLIALTQWDALSPFATVDLGSGGGSATIDISAYNYKAALVTVVATAEAPIALGNITGAWPGAQVRVMVAEGSSDISIPLNTPPFFLSNISGPYGWPGTPMASITFQYIPTNTSYKWVEVSRTWRTS